MMKVFNFKAGDYTHTCSGNNEEEAKEILIEAIGKVSIDSVKEIPESEWEEEIYNIWEDNNKDSKPYKTSIYGELVSWPVFLFTNDPTLIN